MKKHFNKINNFITRLEQYGYISGKPDNFRRINFNSLFAEILNEHKLVEKYPQVRYHFNLLDAKSFISDYRKVKDILKHLLVNSFYYSSIADKNYVSVTVHYNGLSSEIQILSSGCFLGEVLRSNAFKLFFRRGTLSEGAGVDYFFIKESLKKLKGNMLFASTKDQGTTINIKLPDLESNKNIKSILPYSRSLRVM